MTDVSGFFIVAALLAFILATHGIWAPRRLGVKISAVITTALFLPLAYAATLTLLSKPKPVHLEWWLARADEATVLGSSMREGDGIYLWLQMAELAEPRAYVLPWSRELAQELQEALREAEENGSAVQMRLPFEPSLDNRDPKFYALPQPALPPKERLDEGPQMFTGPGRDA
ncbi:MAG: hypothetical protein R3D25_05125 [Geminicoccaceae bacterium]